mmetsp:Transcript_57995/g.164787  ORF Transcript_57995/g.164787 Transcript_57995/m.164787 type:complete len:237 (-) Transcript_57995:142-852(-)
MDFDNESLLKCFCNEEEEKQIIEWNNENDHKRSDIFEYRLEAADKLREEGNELFKAGDCATARQRYYAGIWHLDFDIGQQWNMMDKHQNDLNTRKLKVVGNICAAYLKEKDWVNTKKAADIGLRHMEKSELKDDEAKAKFLYRKGYANLERGFNEDAYEALKKADAMTPGDRQLRQALRQADQGQKADRKKAKEVYKAVLLTEEEKACKGPTWQASTLRARCRARFRQWCCRRKGA